MPDVADGQARLRVDSFGLTANNITYAVFGDAMSYWDFFPGPEGWGRVPMWGFAEVEESKTEGVDEGTRVYGYIPPSSHLLITPDAIGVTGFADASPHREALPSAYHRFLATGADPFYKSGTEALQMLLRPLFYTSFLIDDQIDDDGLVERGPVVISSASSKTAIAAAFLLAQRSGAEVVGLTSAGSKEFVEGLGIYGRTVTYDEIDSLDAPNATFVDVAGDADVRAAVHNRLQDSLIASIAVGVTHWEDPPMGGPELPGPQPVFFFAPTRIIKRAEDWGRETLNDNVAAAWSSFEDWAGTWLEPIPGEGFEAVQAAYEDVIEGRVAPNKAHVLSLPT